MGSRRHWKDELGETIYISQYMDIDPSGATRPSADVLERRYSPPIPATQCQRVKVIDQRQMHISERLCLW